MYFNIFFCASLFTSFQAILIVNSILTQLIHKQKKILCVFEYMNMVYMRCRTFCSVPDETKKHTKSYQIAGSLVSNKDSRQTFLQETFSRFTNQTKYRRKLIKMNEIEARRNKWNGIEWCTIHWFVSVRKAAVNLSILKENIYIYI